METFDPWDWAIEALKELKVDEIFSPEEITIILIGKSQEGKTSLALRLLGANDEEVKLLEKPLRGLRGYGKSATPVPIKYKSIKENITSEILSEIEKEIKKAREEKFPFLELKIPLPFCEDITGIIDLPGLESEDTPEDLEKFLFNADLLIYVCGGDNISDFCSYDPYIQHIMSRWEVNPETSIIVLTMAYEIEQERFRAILSPEELYEKVKEYFEDKMVEQHQRENKKISKEDLPLIVPVCLKTANYKEIWKKATKIGLEKIKEIIKKNPKRLKIRAALSYPLKYKREIERKYKELKNFIDKKKKYELEIETLNKKIKDIKKEIKDKKLEIENLKALIPNFLKEVKKKIYKCELSKFIEELPWEERVGQKVELLRKEAREYNNKIKEKIGELLNKEIEKYPKRKVKLQEIFLGIKDGVSNFLNKELNRVQKGDVIVEGWFWGVKWEESVENLKLWAKEIKKNILSLLKSEFDENLQPFIKKTISEIKREISDYQNLEKIYKEELEKNEKEIKDINEEINKIKKEINMLTKKYKEIKRYKECLKEKFISNWNKEIQLINNSNNILEILYKLACLWQMKETLKEIVEWLKIQKGGDNGA